MFAYVEGEVRELDPDNGVALVVSGGGLGIDVHFVPALCPLISPGGRAAFYLVASYSKEAVPTYAGFSTAPERAWAQRLLSLRGLGLKGVLQILQDVPLEDIESAMISKNHELLCEHRRFSTKTGQRIAQELVSHADKWPPLLARPGKSGDELPGMGDRGLERKCVAAMVSLGYSSAEAQRRVKTVAVQGGEQSEILRQAIALAN